jgi:hypothetical protein
VCHSGRKETKKDRHRKRRENQFRRWQDIIPSLIPLLLDIRKCTLSGRWPFDPGTSSANIASPPCTCPRKVNLKVTKVRWDGTPT